MLDNAAAVEAEEVCRSEERGVPWKRNFRMDNADIAVEENMDKVEASSGDEGSQGGNAGVSAILDEGIVFDEVLGDECVVSFRDVLLDVEYVDEVFEDLALTMRTDAMTWAILMLMTARVRAGDGREKRQDADEEKCGGDHDEMDEW